MGMFGDVEQRNLVPFLALPGHLIAPLSGAIVNGRRVRQQEQQLTFLRLSIRPWKCDRQAGAMSVARRARLRPQAHQNFRIIGGVAWLKLADRVELQEQG